MTTTPPDAVASLDQMGAFLKSLAETLGAYRTSLLGTGMPEGTVEHLVTDYATRCHQMMCPAPNPLGGLFGGGK